METVKTRWRYLPILKWKQREREALKNTTPSQWAGLLPLLELPATDAAPDRASLRAAVPAYLSKFVKQNRPGKRHALAGIAASARRLAVVERRYDLVGLLNRNR